MVSKICSKCKTSKPVGQFHKYVSRGKIHSECKACTKIMQTNWRKRNASHCNEYYKNWIFKNKDKVKFNQLRKKYGIEPSTYKSMLINQSGKCAICQKEDYTWLAVDHCHTTGRIRGLLCRYCNLVVGNSKENADICIRASVYIRQFQGAMR